MLSYDTDILSIYFLNCQLFSFPFLIGALSNIQNNTFICFINVLPACKVHALCIFLQTAAAAFNEGSYSLNLNTVSFKSLFSNVEFVIQN